MNIPSDYTTTQIRREHDTIKLVFELTKGKGFIAGGFARYCVSENINPICPGDIDVFTGDMGTFTDIYLAFKANPSLKQRSDTEIETKFEYVFKEGFKKEVLNIQLIKPVHISNMNSRGDFISVLTNFDFTISKAAILANGEAWMHHQFERDDRGGHLVIEKIHCPISSMKRVIKYAQKGYTIESKELLKLFKDYETRPTDWKKLVDEGLSQNRDNWPKEKQNEFVRAMYMD